MTEGLRWPTLFEDLSEEDKQNVPLLLDRIYGRLTNGIDLLSVQIKGRISQQEGRLTALEGRMRNQERCPCAVYRDPAHDCVVLDVRDELAKIRAENAAQLASIKNRLSWWAGAMTVIVLFLHLLGYFWPLLKELR